MNWVLRIKYKHIMVFQILNLFEILYNFLAERINFFKCLVTFVFVFFFYTEDAEAPGNIGMLDQVAAMNWVKTNIEGA